MKILGFDITKNKENKSFYVHLVIVSNKRGRKILYLNGREIKNKNFIIELWPNDESFANFANRLTL